MAEETNVKFKFHEWAKTVYDSDYDVICYSGEFGSGKTSTAIYKCYDSLIKYPGMILVVLRNLYKELTTATIPDFFEYIWGDRNSPGGGVKWNKSDNKLILPNKSEIQFFAADKEHQIKTLKGMKCGMLWGDQPESLPESILAIAMGRVRQKGYPCQTLLTPNPAGEGHYLKRWFFMPEFEYDVKQENIDGHECTYGYWIRKLKNKNGSFTRYLGVTAKPKANEPNLKDGYYDDLERTLSHDQVQKLVYAQWYGASGAIYEVTSDNYAAYTPPEYRHIQRFEGMDYGISATGAMTWYNICYDGDTYYITDEFYQYESNIHSAAEFASGIKEKWDCLPVFQAGCPRAFQTEAGSGHKVKPADLFRDLGIILTPYTIQIDVRRSILQPLFKLKKIIIDDKCVELAKELRGYTWDNGKAVHHGIEAIERAISRHWRQNQNTKSNDIKEITKIHAAAPYLSNDF